ncbi:SpoIIIAH-like family protein [Lentibacillus cibarius]|uniref:SpoIIIAH-like family protein n=1 Tax=Lentibacillus cibarius TaxID=2583219 RepID=A0A5S3QG41_9BACI|nr:SpoIIIAH-like family protein [Lentibacillus cibarius]TMN20777.1 SpoIIIAH-like family protein [Lentibacillus cibarius]
MLKKQTVWLLTMLSLMIVLSVYYITSPNGGDLAYLPEGEDSAEETASDAAKKEEDTDAKDKGAQVGDISQLEEDQLFATIRMQIQDERSAARDRLDDVVASSSASVQEKNEARNEMNKLDKISSKERILEESIISSADYSDVLIRHDEDRVQVYVKESEKLSNSEVVNIMQMVKDEFGDIPVRVDYQPTDK